MKKTVVLGGAGFIGSHIVEETCRDREVVVLDDLTTGRMENIAPFAEAGRVRFARGSILDRDLLERTFEGAETVFHLAALISVPESMEKKAEYVRVNTIGTLNVLEAARLCGVESVVFSSSAAVYGDSPLIPKREDMLPEPRSPYAVTKLDGEYYCRLFREEYGIAAASLRYFNVFGPRQRPDSPYAAAVPVFIDRALKGEPIDIFGDGEQTRDFIFVKDVVRANLLAADGGGSLFNVALGGRTTINDLARAIVAITGSSSPIRHLPERPGDVKHSQADNSRIVAGLGFEPAWSLEAGLAETVASFASSRP